MSAVRVSNVAPYASGRMRTTISAGRSLGSRHVRASSRNRRFSLFLATAEFLWSGTIKPTRVREPDKSARGEAATRTSR